jgi:hypothetical protein
MRSRLSLESWVSHWAIWCTNITLDKIQVLTKYLKENFTMKKYFYTEALKEFIEKHPEKVEEMMCAII